MTTYTVQGIGIDFNGATPLADAFVPSVSLEIVFANGLPVFSYVITDVSGPLPEVDITTAAFSIKVDGVVVDHPGGADEAFLGFIIWIDDIGIPRFTIILDLYVVSSDIDNWFVLGGDPLPSFANVTEFNNFLANSLSDTGSITSGQFAPSTDISVANVPGVMSNENDIVQGTSGDDVINAGIGNDVINGNDGNDTITPGDNDGSDVLIGSTGNDEYIFTGITGNDDYYEFDYSNLAGPIVVTVDGTTNTGSIVKGAGGVDGTDTLTDINEVLAAGWFDGGVGWGGTAGDDIYNITTANEQWNKVFGSAGNDTFNITRTGSGFTVLEYLDAAAGVNVNTNTGVVSDDGDGGMDTINGYFYEIRGSQFSDVIVGNAFDESFIGYGGNDNIDGGGGFDRLRYDRNDFDTGINANLNTGIVTGTWKGQAFTHTISNIEYLRGSNLNDIIVGNDLGNRLDGRKGDDNITGGSGNDRIDGGDDNDTITPGENTGFDQMFGSRGNDEYVFTGIVGNNSYYELNYSNLSAGIELTVNGSTNTGSVNKGVNGTDTITDVEAPLNTGWFNGGIKWVGTAFDDVFNITTDDEQWNQVSGGAGNDTFNITRNGTGVTRIDYSGAAAGINVNLANGTASDDGDGGVDTINGDVWEIRGSNFTDTIVGSNNDESFIGRSGNDNIDGGGGIDRLRYDRSGVDGGITADLSMGTVTGSWFGQAFTHTISNIEWVRGSNLNDSITGDGGKNTLEGRDGDDTLNGGAGVDSLYGDDGHDTLNGGTQGDTLHGGEGNDILNGDQGADTIYGGEGNDTIDGGSSSGDVMNGEGGDDIIFGGQGNDIIDGGTGVDTVDYSGFGGNVTVNLNNNGSPQTSGGGGVDVINNVENVIGGDFADRLTGRGGDSEIHGGAGGDRIFGLGGEDMLFGEGANDFIQGGNGDDFIDGGDGQDQLNGGNDNDTILGGDDNSLDRLTGAAGNDTLDGGGGRDILRGDSFVGGASVTGGNDIFDFNDVNDSLAGGLRDIIRDFVQGEDLMDLSDIDAIMGGADDAFTFIGTSGFSGTAGEVRYAFGGSHTIISADLDGDGIADFQIDLNGNINLLASDFIL